MTPGDPAAVRPPGWTTVLNALEWLATGTVTWPVPHGFPTESEMRLQPPER